MSLLLTTSIPPTPTQTTASPVEIVTMVNHVLVLRAPSGRAFVMLAANGATRIAFDRLTVNIVCDPHGKFRPFESSYSGEGHGIREGGTLERAIRRIEGRCLNWLPQHLQDAIVETATGLGVSGLVEDIATQWTPERRRYASVSQTI